MCVVCGLWSVFFWRVPWGYFQNDVMKQRELTRDLNSGVLSRIYFIKPSLASDIDVFSQR